MRKFFSPLTTSMVLTVVATCLSTACLPQGYNPFVSETSSNQGGEQSIADPGSEPSSIQSTGETVAPAANAAAPAAAADPYPEAINRASSAFNLSRSAQSRDDWRLVANRWNQAIDLMASVPPSSPNHSTAQTKLLDYRRNRSFAEQQATQPNPSGAITPGRVIRVAPEAPTASVLPSSQPTASLTNPASGDRVYQAPIIRRAGGTPVIMVAFNGNQQFEMIVDTGASGTVITPRMANALGVVPVGQTQVATASASSATFLLGRVRSVEVNGALTQNMVVAIAGPELSTGLLGHDFFGNYDVTVRQNVVEFRER